MEHTPGPWRHAKEAIRHANGVVQTFNPDTVLTEDGELAICQVYGMPINTTLEDIAGDPRWADGLANARLIAAAPDLLAVVEEIGNHLYEKQDYFRVREMARAAIAKAKGETA